jgi:hypothetical protein
VIVGVETSLGLEPSGKTGSDGIGAATTIFPQNKLSITTKTTAKNTMRLQRLAFGARNNFRDIPARSARARATALKHRPWESGRIGSIESQVSRILTGGPVGKDYTTGELARAIYADPLWDQDFRLRKEGEPVPPIKSWMLARIRKAAAAFADPVGRVGRGHAILWRARLNQYWWDVRRAKTERDKARRIKR